MGNWYHRNDTSHLRVNTTLPPICVPEQPNTDLAEQEHPALAFARAQAPFPLDPLQLQVLAAPRGILNCSRQWGKSTVSALKALHAATALPNQTILIVAPTQRQSAELLRRCRAFPASAPAKATRHELAFPNGSRILALPSSGDAIRGFSANLLIIDEAARVPDPLYHALTPMLAATNGDLWLLSTPNGPRGFFHQEWTDTREPWLRVHAPATSCPSRIPPVFLERERRKALRRGQLAAFEQEYLAEFKDTGSSIVFASGILQSALKPELVPLFTPHHFPPPAIRSTYYLGLDLGRRRDHSALVIAEVTRLSTGRRCPITFEFADRTHLRIRHVERIPLETRYSSLANYIASLLEHRDLSPHPCHLIVDATGVGDAVLEMLRAARLRCQITPVTITAGADTSRNSAGEFHVPKSELVSNLENLFHEELLEIASACSHTDELLDELAWFERTKHASGHVTYAAARSSIHDDLVIAASLACWRAFSRHGRSLNRLERSPIAGPLW